MWRSTLNLLAKYYSGIRSLYRYLVCNVPVSCTVNGDRNKLSLFHINCTTAVHQSTCTTTIFGISCCSLTVLYATPQERHAISQPQRHKLNFRHVHFPCDSPVILWGSKTVAIHKRLLQDAQGVRTTNVRARASTHIFHSQMAQDCCSITLQWPCSLLRGCRKKATCTNMKFAHLK